MTTVDLTYFTCITRIDFDVSTLTGSYVDITGGGFSDDVKILKIINIGNTADIDISYDGVNANDWYAAGQSFILDLQTNHKCNSSYGSGTLGGRKGQLIYGKVGTAGTGTLRIIGYR